MTRLLQFTVGSREARCDYLLKNIFSNCTQDISESLVSSDDRNKKEFKITELKNYSNEDLECIFFYEKARLEALMDVVKKYSVDIDKNKSLSEFMKTL